MNLYLTTNPGLTPYYDKDFFSIIQHYKATSPMNISTMSVKQWYHTLLEDKVLMNQPDNSPATLIPVRSETLHPHSDWPQIWSNVHSKGLGSELTSFLFKLVHGLLPTQDRVSRIGLGNVDIPGVCLLCRMSTENLLHCFFECQHNVVVGHGLLGYVQHVVPNLSPESALILDFDANLPDEESLAACVMIATGLHYIWESRVSKKVVTLFKMRAEIEARVSVLRRSRHNQSGLLIERCLLN